MLSSVIKPGLTIAGSTIGAVTGLSLDGAPELMEQVTEMETSLDAIGEQPNHASMKETIQAIETENSEFLSKSVKQGLEDGKMPELPQELQETLSQEQINTYNAMQEQMPEIIQENIPELFEALQQDAPNIAIHGGGGAALGGGAGSLVGGWAEKVAQERQQPAAARGM